MEDLKKILESGVKSLDISINEAKISKLMDYLALFVKWNKAYNLSAIRDPEQMVTKHLLDSLAVVPHISQRRLIDVGTGGGLPGIPLAIVYPEKHFTLLDSAGKKMRFLFQVKQALDLSNVEIQNCRVESFQPSEAYDAVISRAFASIKDMVSGCQHLLRPEGKFLAMKGVFPQQELSELAKHFKVENSFALQVPGLSGERCLVVLRVDHRA